MIECENATFERVVEDGEFIQLSRGAYGDVYEAIWKEKEKKVAAKKISLSEQKAGNVAPSIAEADAIRRLSATLSEKEHPNIVKIFDCTKQLVREKEFFWVFMELCEHGDLKSDFFANKLKEKSPKDIEIMKVRIMADIAHGITFLHDNGIVHRDITHKNILFAKDPSIDFVVKLTDFSLSKKLEPEDMSSLRTTKGQANLPFKPPEFLPREDRQ